MFDHGLREEWQKPLMKAYVKVQTVLWFTWVELLLTKLPDIWHEAANSWQRRRLWGGARGTQWALLLAASEWLHNMNTQTGEHCWSLYAPHVSFLSAPHLSLHPSLSSATFLAYMVSTRGEGGIEERQLCLAVINPQDVIHKLFTINSLSVYICG